MFKLTGDGQKFLDKIKEALKFDNVTLRELPVDPIEKNYPRTVQALQSRVKPTLLKNPRIVCWSDSAAEDLGIEKHNLDDNPLFTLALAGHLILPGSQPTAHNYCGHQFGSFAGQLGDGAAINLGEIVVPKNVSNDAGPNAQDKLSSQGDNVNRCFIQVKGGGPTPYSRSAEGRKVLRSSIREFLCSEAMHHLGFPSTRALCIIKSDDTVRRDMFYDGNEKLENCAVVCRFAETFFRFGTFELFKNIDPLTQRAGPCAGMNDFKKNLLDFTIDQYFKNMRTEEKPLSKEEIAEYSDIDEESLQRYARFYMEIIRDSSRLVLMWESVGFCHGVLNTDNMSIKSLTIDYGPFCFIERFNNRIISNTSDTEGRYRFCNQKKIFHWNLTKLAEALDPLLPLSLAKKLLEKHFMKGYSEGKYFFWWRKLGLIIQKPGPGEWCEEMFVETDNVIQTFFTAMENTYSDFTNTIRSLSLMDLPGLPNHAESKEALLNYLISGSSSLKQAFSEVERQFEDEEVQIILSMIDSGGPRHRVILEKIDVEKYTYIRDRYNELSTMTQEAFHQDCIAHWTTWLDKYSKYLEKYYNLSSETNLLKINSDRRDYMNRLNPVFVLRNHAMQKAIVAAEKDDYRWTYLLLCLAENPMLKIDFEEATKCVSDITKEEYEALFEPDDKVAIRVSCSS